MKFIAFFLKWTARILSLLSIITLILTAIEEGFIPENMDFKKFTMITFFPVGVIVGFIVAWWYEAIGGGISILGLTGFYLSAYIFFGSFPEGNDYFKATSPALVFIFYALITYNSRHRENYL